MGYVTLVDIFKHPITQKYLRRSGVHHAVKVTEIACRLATEREENPELATKAALLHDMGHFEWYREGKWDYEEYRKHDIHAIKGAERAHKLLIRLGENRVKAKRDCNCNIITHRLLFTVFCKGISYTPTTNHL